MFAIVEDGKITGTANSVRQLFPNTSFPSSIPNDFLTENNVHAIEHGEKKDEAYYSVSPSSVTVVDGVPVQGYTGIAKELNDDGAVKGLKTIKTEEVKDTANKLLAKTDWMVIRKYERDVAIPSATATYRAAVIAECGRLEGAIASASDVDALKTVMQGQNWPTED